MTTINLKIFSLTSSEDVIKYNYNEDTLKLSLTFKHTTDSQTCNYLKCDGDDLLKVLPLGSDVLFCKVKIIDAFYLCDLARFHTLFVFIDIGNYSNVGDVKSCFLHAFTLRQRVEVEDLAVMFP